MKRPTPEIDLRNADLAEHDPANIKLFRNDEAVLQSAAGKAEFDRDEAYLIREEMEQARRGSGAVFVGEQTPSKNSRHRGNRNTSSGLRRNRRQNKRCNWVGSEKDSEESEFVPSSDASSSATSDDKPAFSRRRFKNSSPKRRKVDSLSVSKRKRLDFGLDVNNLPSHMRFDDTDAETSAEWEERTSDTKLRTIQPATLFRRQQGIKTRGRTGIATAASAVSATSFPNAATAQDDPMASAYDPSECCEQQDEECKELLGSRVNDASVRFDEPDGLREHSTPTRIQLSPVVRSQIPDQKSPTPTKLSADPEVEVTEADGDWFDRHYDDRRGGRPSRGLKSGKRVTIEKELNDRKGSKPREKVDVASTEVISLSD